MSSRVVALGICIVVFAALLSLSFLNKPTSSPPAGAVIYEYFYNETSPQTTGKSETSGPGAASNSPEGGPSAVLGGGSFGGGSGTIGDPYLITDCLDLQAMQNNLAANYALNNSIDCSATSTWDGGKGFNPIGCGSSNCGTRVVGS